MATGGVAGGAQVVPLTTFQPPMIVCWPPVKLVFSVSVIMPLPPAVLLVPATRAPLGSTKLELQPVAVVSAAKQSLTASRC